MSSIFSRILEKGRTLPAWFSRWPKWVRWIALFVVIIAIGAGSYAVVQANQAKTAASQESTFQTATARQGNLILQASGTGYLAAVSESEVGFDVNGKLEGLSVELGDKVEKGQLLAELDDSSQQASLEDAKRSLRELTSPESVANAKIAVATAEADVINAQYAVNNLQYWKNDALIQNYYAKLVVAKSKLDQAQTAYDSANVGEYINNVDEAGIYQNLYSAQQAYNTAKYYYSVYSQKPSQRQVDEATAKLELAQAKLIQAQNYVTALTGGEVPEDATGSSLEQLRQAKLAVQTAQENLDATKLYAPISGVVMTLTAKVGQTISGTIMTIDDLSQATVQFYMDASDWGNVKVGYDVAASFDELPDQVFPGKVTQVMPGLVSIQGSSMVEGLALLENSVEEIGLPIGVEVGIDVISGQTANAVLVPVEALHEISTGKYTVFVVENGKPKLRSVEVGLMNETFAEVISGLNVGEVVTTGIVETQQ
ncbi:MAG: efflux RND transporter periplasmic adaptor subunit [Chloroflexota bacterium]